MKKEILILNYININNFRLQNENDEPKLSDLEKELNDHKAEEVRLLEELEALQKEESDLALQKWCLTLTLNSQ